MAEARILAVDDQLYFRVFLEDLLRQEGYDVATAGGGAEALDLLGRERFDVVLTDLVMPETDGLELVRRLRSAGSEIDVVVVTGVGDVQSAVDAMKEGATDYLLKPIDRSALLRTLEGLLQRRRMREEHARLMAENLEFMGAFTLHERALALFATLRPEPLADRIVEGLCLETRAHGGVLWMARPGDERRLRLLGVRGLVRAREEAPELDAAGLPPELAPLAAGAAAARLAPAGLPEAGDGDGPRALFVALRAGERLLGLARLSDPLGGGAFGEAEVGAAERFASFAGQAVANALEFRALEQQSFRDPSTGAYTRAYFEDVVANEVRKASRFGRTFSLVRIELDGAGALRTRLGAAPQERWLAELAAEVARALRASDLLAVESAARLCLLLPETDALGAAVLKRRVRAALQGSEPLRGLGADERPAVLAAAATFPGDGGDAEALSACLDARLEQVRASALHSLGLETASFESAVAALLDGAAAGRPETAPQMTRLCLEEVRRRPFERGALFVAPGPAEAGPLREALEALQGVDPQTQVVIVAEPPEEPTPSVPVTWLSPRASGVPTPFLVYYADGASYALLRDAEAGAGEPAALYHTADPALVEHLAFGLGRELGVPVGEPEAAPAARGPA